MMLRKIFILILLFNVSNTHAAKQPERASVQSPTSQAQSQPQTQEKTSAAPPSAAPPPAPTHRRKVAFDFLKTPVSDLNAAFEKLDLGNKKRPDTPCKGSGDMAIVVTRPEAESHTFYARFSRAARMEDLQELEKLSEKREEGRELAKEMITYGTQGKLLTTLHPELVRKIHSDKSKQPDVVAKTEQHIEAAQMHYELDLIGSYPLAKDDLLELILRAIYKKQTEVACYLITRNALTAPLFKFYLDELLPRCLKTAMHCENYYLCYYLWFNFTLAVEQITDLKGATGAAALNKFLYADRPKVFLFRKACFQACLRNQPAKITPYLKDFEKTADDFSHKIHIRWALEFLPLAPSPNVLLAIIIHMVNNFDSDEIKEILKRIDKYLLATGRLADYIKWILTMYHRHDVVQVLLKSFVVQAALTKNDVQEIDRLLDIAFRYPTLDD